MRFNDALIGAFLIILGIVVFLYARTLPAMPGQQYGAAVFPMLVACGLGGCGVVLSASGMRRWEGAMFLADWTGDPRAWARVGGAIALVLLYIFGADYLGFVITCALILVALFLMLSVRWWLAIIIALVVTVAIERSFGSLLLVPLPRGLFWV